MIFNFSYYIQPQSISDYIKSVECVCPCVLLQCECQQGRLRTILGSLEEFLNDLCKSNFYGEDPPRIRVKHEKEIQAEAGYCIDLTTGLINHFLDVVSLPQLPILGFEVPGQRNRELVGMTAVRWAVAHEFYHVLFHHKGYFQDPITAQALELDADMCAAAVIYRAYQGMYGRMTNDDDDLRCLAFYCLFCVIRPLASLKLRDGGHPSVAMRLWFIKNKLSTLRKNPEDHPDEEYQTEESHRAHARLRECLHNCEVLHTVFGQKNPEDINLLEELNEIEIKQLFSPLALRWDEMKYLVRGKRKREEI